MIKSQFKLFFMIMLLLASPWVMADRMPMDEGVEASIESEIILDEDLSNVRISITCTDGVVELNGEVSSVAQQNEVIAITQATYGVAEVDATRLNVNPY